MFKSCLSRRVASFGWLLVLGVALSPQGGRAQDKGLDSEKLARIAPKLLEHVNAKQVSGAVTLAAHNGKIISHEAVGFADLETRRPMEKDTIFAIASMTKPIAATAVMILQDDGKLSVDDPIEKYVPEFKQSKLKAGPPSRPITLRDLMTHTSGVVGEQRNEGSLEETARKMAQRPLAFEPGTQWAYSPGLSICGRAVEVASGQPFDRFVEKRIFKPLGMTDTSFMPNEQQQKRLARLYQPSKDKTSLEQAKHWINDLSPGRTPNPSGGLFSTASDLFKFYQMILNGGEANGKRIVSEAGVKEMTRIQTSEIKTGFTPGNGWGYGWCVVREPQGVSGMLSPGSFGHGGAFGTQGWIDPKRRMIYVLLIQRTNFGNSDGSDIRKDFQELAAAAVSAN